ncbi:MAG TPA: preprotein translocase subunit SecE [Candidatus Dormibacteraeota bacterium]|nr:preprotein translocase subunit SecE [Candidatus Dormibacteraeota bacterium]
MSSSESTKRPKRRLRSSETVRQRADKAQALATQPTRKSIIGAGLAKANRPISLLGKIFNYQPLKSIVILVRLIGRLIFPSFLRNSWRELRLVTWPSRRQSRQLTLAVLVFAFIFGALVAVVDYGLDKIFKHLLLK